MTQRQKCEGRRLKKRRPLSNRLAEAALGRLFLALHRAGILPPRIDIAVDEFDDTERRVVAVTEARLQDAGIAAVALFVARPEHVEELFDQRDIAHLRDRLAARMQVAALAERDQLLDDGPQVLGLWQCGDDLLMLDQCLRHVGEHRLTVLGGAVEAALRASMIHRLSPVLAAAVPRYGRPFLASRE